MKISQILMETTIPQITNHLIKFRDDTKEVIGKSKLFKSSWCISM